MGRQLDLDAGIDAAVRLDTQLLKRADAKERAIELRARTEGHGRMDLPLLARRGVVSGGCREVPAGGVDVRREAESRVATVKPPAVHGLPAAGGFDALGVGVEKVSVLRGNKHVWRSGRRLEI